MRREETEMPVQPTLLNLGFVIFAAAAVAAPAELSLALGPYGDAVERPIELNQSRLVTFRIEGMSCGRCATSVSTALNRAEGVVQADVTFDERIARVEYDPARTGRERLMDLIRELGFRVAVAEEN